MPNWAAALKRVWGIDIFGCCRCGGKLVILAFIEKPRMERLGAHATSTRIRDLRGRSCY